jgi:hypothetical protein
MIVPKFVTLPAGLAIRIPNIDKPVNTLKRAR